MPTPSPAGTFSNGPASASSKEHKSSSYFSNRQTLLSPLPSPVPGVHAQPNGSAVPGIARRTSSAGSGIAPTASHPSSLIGLGPPPSGANLGGKKHSLSLSLSTSAAAAHSAPHPPGSTTPGSAWGGGSGGPGGAGPWASGGSAGGTPGERGRNGGTTPTLGAGGWSAAQSAHSGRDRWSAVFGSGVGTIGTGTGTNNTNGSATGSGTGSVSGAICTGGGRGTSPSSRRGTPPITPGAGGPTSASPSAIAAVPTAAQQQNGELHPLRYTWTLFFLHRAPGGRKGAPLLDGTIAGAGGIAVERYEEGMRKVASFGSVSTASLVLLCAFLSALLRFSGGSVCYACWAARRDAADKVPDRGSSRCTWTGHRYERGQSSVEFM